MRSILITVMMLIVVAVIFVNVVTKNGGLQDAIEKQGGNAITSINNLYNPSSGSGS
jgi:ABC-type cobalt transport system substrate-binding protein